MRAPKDAIPHDRALKAKSSTRKRVVLRPAALRGDWRERPTGPMCRVPRHVRSMSTAQVQYLNGTVNSQHRTNPGPPLWVCRRTTNLTPARNVLY